jgi:hypothetical protein
MTVLWQCDPTDDGPALASSSWGRQHSRLAGSDTSTETTAMQGMRLWVNLAYSRRYSFPAWVSSCELLGSTSVSSVVSKP